MHRFGPFEADFSAGELRKHGVRIKVQEQPLRVLQALVARPGQVVSREELRQLLWADDTFVDFERSLNSAVGKLRLALGDSADKPLYVETLARKGYRFVAPVVVVQNTPADPGLPTPSRQTIRPRTWMIAAAGLVVVAGLIASYTLRAPHSGADRGPVSFVASMPRSAILAGNSFDANMAISPDGRNVAYVAAVGDRQAIYLRPMASDAGRKLEGTEGAELPFWHPGGSEIGFYAEGRLKSVSPATGAVRTICSTTPIFGATWSENGTILLAADSVIYRVESNGGRKERLHGLPELREGQAMRHAWPQFLPGGNHFVFFTAHTDPARSEIRLGWLQGQPSRLLFRNRTKAMFASPHWMLYVRDGVLLAQRWDTDDWKKIGEPAPVARDVNTFSVGAAAFTVSDSGVLAYRTGAPEVSQLVLRNRSGQRLRTLCPPGNYLQIALSPDEKTVAFNARVRRDESVLYKVWLCSAETEVVSRPDFGELNQADPVWSPDSRQLAFASFHLDGMKTRLHVWDVGQATARELFSDSHSNKPDDWSRAGDLLLFRRNDQVAFALPLAGTIAPVAVGDSPSTKDHLKLSPDGKLVAFTEGELPQAEIFVADFPGMTRRTQVSANGGVQPIWRQDGRELFFASPNGDMMSATVESSAQPKFSAPNLLFRGEVRWLNRNSNKLSQYAATGNGSRFWRLEPVPSSAPDELHVLVGWPDLLHR